MKDSVIQKIEGVEITVQYGNKPYTIDLVNVLDVEEPKLTQHFSSQASVYGFFGLIYAEAERRYNMAKAKGEAEYAAADDFIRREASLNGAKITEGQVKSLVLLDESYQAAQQAEFDAKYDLSVMKIFLAALEQRKDMLISLGAHLRQEADMTGMTVRDAEYQKTIDNVKEKMAEVRARKAQ